VVEAQELSARSPQSARFRWLVAESIGVALLAFIAALPRFIAPELVPFGYDEALEALRARAIALGARPVANEVTSWLLPDPALMLYVYAVVEAVSDPTVARTWLLGALNTLSVLLAYFWGRSVGGSALGFGTALLYACSPWAIYFGRQPWVNAQPVLTSLMLLSATRVVQHAERRWSLLFFLALGLQMQTHLLGAVLVLPATLTVLVFIRAWGISIIPGVVVVAAINTPFAIHLWELKDSVQSTLVGAAPVAGASATIAPVTPNMPMDAPRLLGWFVGGSELQAKLTEGAEAFRSLGLAQNITSMVLVIAMVVGLVLAMALCFRRVPGWKGYALAIIWLTAPLGAAMLQSRPVYIHYMTALVPSCFLLAALPFSVAFKLHRLLGAVAFGCLIAIGVVHQVLFTALLQGVRLEASLPSDEVTAVERQTRLNDQQQLTRASGIGDLFGTPLRYWRDVARSIRSTSAQRESNTVTVYTGLSDPYELYVDQRRMALDYMLGPTITARFPFEGTVVLPLQNPELTLQLPGVELPRTIRNPERLLEVPTPGTGDATRLLHVPARALRDQSLGRRSIQARFEPGLQLVSYDSPQRLEPGETLALTTFWTFDGYSPTSVSADYSVFFHLLDQDGSIVAQSDGLGLPSDAWRSGDLLVRRVTMPIAQDKDGARLTLAIGVYEPTSLQRARVSLSENRVDDRVVLGSISIR
jgi:hypothetical protein